MKALVRDQKTAIVTGGAGSIGHALCSLFTQHGYQVIALDCLPRPSDLVCSSYIEADLKMLAEDPIYSSEIVSKIFEASSNSPISVLVNNAAIQTLGGVESLTRKNWQDTLDVNLLAPFILTQGLLPILEASHGSVINISSIHARLTKANFVAYATSKAALSGMTRAMAVDLGGRIRVNAIEPAAILTPMLVDSFSGDLLKLEDLKNCHPQSCIGTPEEVAGLAIAMASGSLKFLHGACVGLDGGISSRLHDPM